MSTLRASAWSVTINNPKPADEENIAKARQKGWKVEGQLEKGDSGTEHYQLLVKTPQVRFSAVKSAFPRAHIEPARNVAALEAYVQKEESRVGELPTSSELYPSLQKTWDMLYDWLMLDKNLNHWFDIDPEARLRLFDDFIREKITEGFVLETMGVNPQIRSAIKLYGRSILIRSKVRRQTDRQTDERLEVVKKLGEIISCGYDITNASSSSCSPSPRSSRKASICSTVSATSENTL